ncbi:unnamed protein product [Acanthosepion pharaonis]|uniref:Uncharacterized protein n=1 Tax=Acanthosepion pharaonis TaxID=158019 RepID=A0A812CHA4_ACAPH|nr:unnamed protein product [Sepia pharaonis]
MSSSKSTCFTFTFLLFPLFFLSNLSLFHLHSCSLNLYLLLSLSFSLTHTRLPIVSTCFTFTFLLFPLSFLPNLSLFHLHSCSLSLSLSHTHTYLLLFISPYFLGLLPPLFCLSTSINPSLFSLSLGLVVFNFSLSDSAHLFIIFTHQSSYRSISTNNSISFYLSITACSRL